LGCGQRITVRTSQHPEDDLSGIFVSVDHSGRIQLRLDDGQIRTVSTGDVFFRKT
jgi:biotin-(acetyl-CoA carboxylase) ligase